jgi:hypothetical protein
VNERDGLGDDLVPDFLTEVKEAGFYGWPYSYFGPNEDPRWKGKIPGGLLEKTLVPDVAIGSTCFLSWPGILYQKIFSKKIPGWCIHRRAWFLEPLKIQWI